MSWLKIYHVRRRRWRIEQVDQAATMFDHCALVDRAFISDFAAVDRQRRVEQHRTRDPGRRTRGICQQLLKPVAKRRSDQGIGCRGGKIVRWKRRLDQTAAVEIE